MMPGIFMISLVMALSIPVNGSGITDINHQSQHFLLSACQLAFSVKKLLFFGLVLITFMTISLLFCNYNAAHATYVAIVDL
jgi:hypothetical protein